MVYMRVDANDQIAYGHMMRCLSIANALRDRGENTTFITTTEGTVELAKENGYSCFFIQGKWNDLAGETAQLKKLIEPNRLNVILVDSYYISLDYFSKLSSCLKKVYLGSLRSVISNTDVLINYSSRIDFNFYNEYYDSTKLLLGVKYAPLRKEFQNIPSREITSVTDLLITSGSSDPVNTMYMIAAKLLSESYMKDVMVHIIVGPLNNNINALTSLAFQYKNIVLHHNPAEISKLMCSCQIAIAAAGTTLLELCACGTPTISYAISDEQVEEAKYFDRDDIINYVGFFETTDDKKNILSNIKHYVDMLISNFGYLNKKSLIMKKYIDGNGINYIVNSIMGREL